MPDMKCDTIACTLSIWKMIDTVLAGMQALICKQIFLNHYLLHGYAFNVNIIVALNKNYHLPSQAKGSSIMYTCRIIAWMLSQFSM